MANSTEHRVYVFDEFRLDRANLMLYRDEAEVTLPPKAIETLAILVEKRGEIVSKDDLIEGVWKDAFVEDSNLSHYYTCCERPLEREPTENLILRPYGNADIDSILKIFRLSGQPTDISDMLRRV